MAAADDDVLAMPERRKLTLRTVCAALRDGLVDLGAGADRERSRRDLLALPGIGPWTVEYVAMRALGISTRKIYRPVFVFSFLTFLLNLYLINFVMPAGNRQFVTLRTELTAASAERVVKPRVFYDEYENLMIYVNDVDTATGQWKGVFVADNRGEEPQQESMTPAQMALPRTGPIPGMAIAARPPSRPPRVPPTAEPLTTFFATRPTTDSSASGSSGCVAASWAAPPSSEMFAASTPCRSRSAMTLRAVSGSG